jgi:hypothetical protein
MGGFQTAGENVINPELYHPKNLPIGSLKFGDFYIFL